MAISLRKGEGVNLRKESGWNLKKLTIGLGWDVSGQNSDAYDLDAIAFVCREDGRVYDLGALNEKGKPTLVGGDVVFYNSLNHPSGHIQLSGDNRTGSAGADAEQITVALEALPERFGKIVFVVAIHNAKALGQSFGAVNNAYIRALDGNGSEICRYHISKEAGHERYCSLTFAAVERKSGVWSFQAVGQMHESDRFIDILKTYLPNAQ
ncbi:MULTISPECIES: TerD family protein [Vitreoscilla]|uniref:TerD family protein n=1 Tax=Vitreoscilla stercoraria TaxID=61 RepID=A0ABY4EAU9_VITST|nr:MULTISPECIES: TerD family protein [Vitreoscilla]AUZ05737.1 tellurium resistance protein TerD [Vitreoscilla sp. C1]UOO92876.1 TerD family protein [Vitreoscilla stercoraria]